MRILYSACHEVLEYDDVRMLVAEGHTVFSLGNQFDPDGCGYLRPKLDLASHLALRSEFHLTGCDRAENKITKEFLRHFDVVWLTHDPTLLIENRDAFGDMPVIVRTIGQSYLGLEKVYKDLGSRVHVVRYSDREQAIDGFAKTAAVIYFGKYPSDYLPWSGDANGATFHNSYPKRNWSTAPAQFWWERFAEATGSELWGVGNDAMVHARGRAGADQLAMILSSAAWYFYIYTYPPSYTLSLMEAMLAGVPIIAPSADLAERNYINSLGRAWTRHRYEVPAIVGDGGIFYDTVGEAIEGARQLRADPDFAARLSNVSLRNARRLFNAEAIAPAWTRFLSSIC